MQKRTKWILMIVAAVLALVVLVPAVGLGVELAASQIRSSKPVNYYADAWGIAFPESAKETYSLQTEGRDRWEYSVYTVDPGDDAAFAEYVDAPIDATALENLTAILDDVQVPQSERPDLEQAYIWQHFGKNESLLGDLPNVDKYTDNLYVLYNAKTHTVYTFITHI